MAAAAVAAAWAASNVPPPSGRVTCAIHHGETNQPRVWKTCHTMNAKATTPVQRCNV